MKQPARLAPTSSGVPASADSRWPLYVAPRDAPRFVGTDPIAVLGAAGLSPRLDKEAALSFVAFDQYDDERTFFDGLGLVPSRCGVRSTDGGLRMSPADGPPLVSMNPADAASAVRAAVDTATEEAVAPHEGVALLLSGGLDSSIVAIAASNAWKRLGRPLDRLRFYHLLPDVGAGESRHAQAVAARLGHPYAEMRPVPGDPFEGVDELFALLDGPPDNLGPRTTLACGRRIVEERATLLLTGDGGDEAFGAMPYSRVRAFARRLLPRAVRRALRRSRRAEPVPPFLASVRRPRLRPPPRRGLRGSCALRDSAIRCARNGVISTWMRSLCSTLGIEAGLPLLDYRLTDLVVRIPERAHGPAPLGRALERAAYADRLPETVRARAKDQPPLETGVSKAIEAYGAAWWERWVAGGAMESAGWLTAAQGRALLARASEGEVTAVYRALCLVNLEIWADARGVGHEVPPDGRAFVTDDACSVPGRPRTSPNPRGRDDAPTHAARSEAAATAPFAPAARSRRRASDGV